MIISPVPKCCCHGIEMAWRRSKRRKYGGYWLCRIKKREWDNKYNKSSKGRERDKRVNSKPERFMKQYLSKRTRYLESSRAKTIEELENIRNQLRELGLEPR